MAGGEHKSESGSGMEIVWFLVLLLGGLAVLWWARGGPKPGEVRPGIFIKPITPVTGGGGEGYGPTIGGNSAQPSNPPANQQTAPAQNNTPTPQPNRY